MSNIILINFLVCLVIALAGSKRKMGFWGYLFASLFLSPILGILLLLVSDPKHKPVKPE